MGPFGLPAIGIRKADFHLTWRTTIFGGAAGRLVPNERCPGFLAGRQAA